MLRTIRIIAGDPALRLVALMMASFGIINSSLFPYQSLIAIEMVGLTKGHFALLLILATVVSVVTSVGAGVITDQRSNRRQIALISATAAAFGPLAMLIWPGVPSLILCHGILLPVSGSLFGQSFALARLACHDRPDDTNAVLAAIRSLLSLTFLLSLVSWSVIFGLGVSVMAVYVPAAILSVALAVMTWLSWPRDGQTRWIDTPSGQSLRQALVEIAHPRVLARIGFLGAITGGSALYMTLISLVFEVTPGRGPGEVALFVGLVAGFEVPSMLLVPRYLRFFSRTSLITLGGLIYALYLFLMPHLAPYTVVWLLPALAGISGGVILTLPISYLQDLLQGRPGAGSSLMAVQKVTADTLCAGAFVLGTTIGGYTSAALIGALTCAAGALAIMLADRMEGRR